MNLRTWGISGIVLAMSLVSMVLIADTADAQKSPIFNGAGDQQNNCYGWYYIITGSKFPNGQVRNGDNASGGTMRWIHDDPIWGYLPIDTWKKDDWFPDNSSFALTLLLNGSIVFDNNGIETGTYGDYYQEWGSHGNHGLYRGYSMSNNFDWTYAGYFQTGGAPLTFDTVIGYFDGDGYTQEYTDPRSRQAMWRMNIYSEVAGLLPLNTGKFTGDVFSTDTSPGTFATSDTGVKREFNSGFKDPIWRVTYKLKTPITLPANSGFYFSHDLHIANGNMPVDLSGGYFCPSNTNIAVPDQAMVGTFAHPNHVRETSLGTGAREGTFTPFSDDVKVPIEMVGMDLRGCQFQFDVDLHDLNVWMDTDFIGDTPKEYFVVGLGTGNGQNPTDAQVMVVIWRGTDTGPPTKFNIELQKGTGYTGHLYAAAQDESKFRVIVSFDATGDNMSAQVWPLNGANAGTVYNIPALSITGRDVSSDWFFAGFQSGTAGVEAGAPKSVARATLSNVLTNAKKDSLYVTSDDPHVKSTVQIHYRLCMASLDQTVSGYQAFLSSYGAQSFSRATYTTDPFAQYIINPITAALDLSAGLLMPGGVPVDYNAKLSDLYFTATGEGLAWLQIDPDNGNPLIKTRFSDDDGDEVVPFRLNSNLVVVDDTPPSLTNFVATQSHGNVFVPATPTIQGNLHICVDAKDVGPLVNGSGLASQPTISIDFATGTDVVDQPMYAADGSTNTFCYDYNITGANGCGQAWITINAADDAGNTASVMDDINLNTAQITLDIAMDNTFTGQRGINFWIAGDGSPGYVCKNVNFTGGSANGVVLTALDGLVCPPYGSEISAKDPIHTISSKVALSPAGPNSYKASFTGADKLLNGDCWGTGSAPDDLVDILDFGKFAQMFGANVGANTPCGTPPPHPDFSGNGLVDTADYTFIGLNFLMIGDGVPGVPGPQPKPKEKCTVKEMQDAGIAIAPLYDLNKDGWVTFSEIAEWLAKTGGNATIKP